LVCEFITGGGLCGESLPASLLKEGVAMRDALLRDLAVLNRFDIICMVDERLLLSAITYKSITVKASDDFNKVFKKALKKADYVWLIAPESDGILLDLSEIAYQSNALLLGCGYDATLIGTSKSLSFEALVAANVCTLPVFGGEELMQQVCFNEALVLNPPKWVAKPEDGAGCEGIRLFDTLHNLRDWLKQDDQYLHYFAQPFQPGITASFCMLCRDGKAWLLSSNQQHIACDGSTFTLMGITLNGMQAYEKRFETIARKIANMLPDALGYVGVDVIIDTEKDQIVVIDINPRLTTSYVSLQQALDVNPAQLIVDCVLNRDFKIPAIRKNQVEILL
jgi:tyramine---L-glutamate ligase